MFPHIRLPLLARPLTRALKTGHSSAAKPSPSPAPASSASALPATADPDAVPEVKTSESRLLPQAPNRTASWSRSQQPRDLAMVGPRFENTIFEQQPAPYAAIGLIHQQPVRFSEDRIVVCDGGGGPLGHPRIFINVDKPEVVPCGYCGLPYAHVHHKDALVGRTSYPLP